MRTLWVIDRAFIDNGGWDRLRRQGIYQITRLKENMYPVEDLVLKFDRTDPVNTGVRRFARVRFHGVAGFFLLVDFRDPEAGQRYQFFDLSALLWASDWRRVVSGVGFQVSGRTSGQP